MAPAHTAMSEEAESRRAYKVVDGPKKTPSSTTNSGDATKLVNAIKASSNVGSFKCETCDASFTSYDAYLDHINSRIHQKNAGIHTVERIDDPERIRARLKLLKERKAGVENMRKRLEEDPATVIQERIELRKQEEEERRRKKYQKKKEKHQQNSQQNSTGKESEGAEPDEEAALMASVLGISSFK